MTLVKYDVLSLLIGVFYSSHDTKIGVDQDFKIVLTFLLRRMNGTNFP